jgi:hypothetical protein
MGDDTTAVTRLLQRWQEGERDALDAITPLVCQELRRTPPVTSAAKRADTPCVPPSCCTKPSSN